MAAAPGSAAASRAASALLATGDRAARGRCCVEPLHALRERLRVRIDLRHLAQRCRVRQQVLPDAQLDLAADRQVGRAHQVERAAHRALGRVLDGHDRVVGLPALAGAEDLVDRRARRASTNAPKCLVTAAWLKVPAGPRYAMRSGCSSARHADITCRNTAGDGSFDERAADFRLQAREHLRLALGAIGRRAAAALSADRLRVPRALVEPREHRGRAVDRRRGGERRLGLRRSAAPHAASRRRRTRRLPPPRLDHPLEAGELLAFAEVDERDALRRAAHLADRLHRGADQHAARGDQHDLVVRRTSAARPPCRCARLSGSRSCPWCRGRGACTRRSACACRSRSRLRSAPLCCSSSATSIEITFWPLSSFMPRTPRALRPIGRTSFSSKRTALPPSRTASRRACRR